MLKGSTMWWWMGGQAHSGRGRGEEEGGEGERGRREGADCLDGEELRAHSGEPLRMLGSDAGGV